MRKSLKQQDYCDYRMRPAELFVSLVGSISAVILLAWSFYHNLLAGIPLTAVGILIFRKQRKKREEALRRRLVLEFRECILSVATALRAGYAVENAFLESEKDLQLLFGENSPICRELELIRRGLMLNTSLEGLLGNLADRSGCIEIRQFADMFAIARRSGGNLTEIISDSVALISRRIDTEQEIRTFLSGRELEQKIMKGMPFAILFYIGSTYPGYFDPLYHNPRGVLVMTICLLGYLAACALYEKIWEGIVRELAG